jgi:hypothetical protein
MSISMNSESYRKRDYQGHTTENTIMTGAYANTFKDIQDIMKYYRLYATATTAALTMIISI